MKIQSIALGFLLTLGITEISIAQQNSAPMSAGTTAKVGRESKAEFDSQNQKGAAAVGAVALLTAGSRIEISTAMMPMTTSSSTKVKPLHGLDFILPSAHIAPNGIKSRNRFRKVYRPCKGCQERFHGV